MIYIIGDSHVSIFSGVDRSPNGIIHIQPEFGNCYNLSKGQLRSQINKFEQKLPNFCAIKIGSNTAYNSFTKLPRIEQVILEYKIGENFDYIFTCFGQIDIQNHLIPNSIKNHLTIIETIKICVDRYIETVKYLKEKYSTEKYPKIILGVYGAPATSIGCGNKPRISKNEAIEYNRITLLFNDYLKLKCEEHDIVFKDISRKLLLSDGSTDNKFVVDTIHLSMAAVPLILEEFSDIIIKQTL